MPRDRSRLPGARALDLERAALRRAKYAPARLDLAALRRDLAGPVRVDAGR